MILLTFLGIISLIGLIFLLFIPVHRETTYLEQSDYDKERGRVPVVEYNKSPSAELAKSMLKN